MIPLFQVAMSPEATEAVGKVLDSGYVGQGDIVDKFEENLQERLNTISLPITTNSCTSAITLALMLIGVGPGDEVISTSMTCTATNTPVILAGAKLVWADVSPLTGNIDPESIRRLINNKTKAIICVDWTGRPPVMAAIRKVARGVPIIRDAAHNPYANTAGADYTCFSFGPIKHLTSGDGGALVIGSDRGDDARRARLLRWYGLDRTATKDFRCGQVISEAGGKFHMNDISAMIGCVNLVRLPVTVARHRAHADRLHRFILQLAPRHLTVAPFSRESAYWVFPVTVHGGKRDAFMKHMNKHGVMSNRVHARNDTHPGLGNTDASQIPHTVAFDEIQANIPCGWWMSPRDLQRVEAALRSWSDQNG